MKKNKINIRKVLSILSITLYTSVVAGVYYYFLWSSEAELEQYFIAILFVIPFIKLYYYLTPLLLLKFNDEDLELSKYFPEFFLFISSLFMITFLLVNDIFISKCVLAIYTVAYIVNLGIDKFVNKIT